MFAVEALLIGLVAAFVIGASKTGLPGGALIAVPMLATVFDGRLIAGGTLPILLVADVFAVRWYSGHARWDVLRTLAPWIGGGYVAGIVFFVAVGDAPDLIARTVGVIVLAIVSLQIVRMWRSRSDDTPVHHDHHDAKPPSTTVAATHGTMAGFTTFVANAAGPVVNSYLLRRDLDKGEIIGTSAWLYLCVNLAKIPLYIALGATGGAFFTTDSLLYDAAVVPGVFVGVVAGRSLYRVVPQRLFAIVVIALAALGALRLVI